MFTVKYGYQNSVGNDKFSINYADSVEEYHTPAGSYVMLYRYPTTIMGSGSGAIVEQRIDIGGENQPDCIFVENISGKTVQKISA